MIVLPERNQRGMGLPNIFRKGGESRTSSTTPLAS